MNLDELKKEWLVFDKKIKASHSINEKLIESIVKEKSMSRVSKIKRQYNTFFLLFFAELILMFAILIGNPFDFKYQLQFVPYSLLIIIILVALFNLAHLYRNLNYQPANTSISSFLNSIVNVYEKNRAFEKWLKVLFLLIGFVIPLSFLPQKIQRHDLTTAFIQTGLMLAGTLLLYLFAFRLGIFKNKHVEKFTSYLHELNELKIISAELQSED